MKNHLFLSLFLLTSSPALAASSTDLSAVQAFIDQTVKALEVKTGLSVRVVRDGEVVLRHDSGFADIEGRVAVDAETAFYVASVTKPFTALAALQLAARGRIDLDRSLASYFPDLSFDPALEAESITLRHLLTHTSGIENDGLVMATAFSGLHTPETLTRILAESKPSAEAPLGTFNYTNVGYNIFSMILERQLKTPWQDVLAEEVFEPLKMTHTTSYFSAAERKGWTLAQPYSFFSTAPDEALYLKKADNTMHAAGGMIASADDMARMVVAQLSGGLLDGQQVFDKNSIALSQTLIAKGESRYDIYDRHGYGFGWQIGSLAGDELIHHFGGFAGTHAHVSFMPQYGIGLVVLNNEDMLARQLTGLVASFVYSSLTGKTGFETELYKQVEKLASDLPKLRARVDQEHEKIQSREWRLTLSLERYAGTYSHPFYGDMHLTVAANGALDASFGNLNATLTAFTEPDSMRVEFVPGSGEVMTFTLEEGSIQSLRYSGTSFVRGES